MGYDNLLSFLPFYFTSYSMIINEIRDTIRTNCNEANKELIKQWMNCQTFEDFMRITKTILANR